MLLKQITLLTLSLGLSNAAFANLCPSNQHCYNQPEYDGMQFLAVTGYEAGYSNYPSYASYPSNVMKYRAQNVCKFLGHKKAVYAKANDNYTWDDLIEVDHYGFAQPTRASYYAPHTSFEKLNCK